MASADVRDQGLCSICLSIYTDPVTLRCGHNFCRVCIDRVLDTQDGSGVYSCPECREEIQERSALTKNMNLPCVEERIMSTQPHQEKVTVICCTYCIHSPVPAVKSCLHCEASLCDNHLKVHSKEPEHVLTEPSTNLENRKCSIHKELLKYYCTKDSICICVSCSLAGDHRGHQVEMLDEASENKKEKIRNVLQKLIMKKDKTEERVQSLEEQRRKAQEKASGEAERVIADITDIRKRLDDLEKRVLSEITRQEEQVSDVIRRLEIKKDKLTKKIRHIEELCNMTDPLTVLQNTGDLCDPEEEGGDEDTKGHDGGDEDTKGDDSGDEDKGGHDKTHDVDVDIITEMLHAGFSDIMTVLQTIIPAKKRKKKRKHSPSVRSLSGNMQDSPESSTKYGRDDVMVKTMGVGGEVMVTTDEQIYGQGPVDLLLDVKTAHNKILISDDLKTATWTKINQNRSETAERFQSYQVMSSRRFSSGKHYWDVQIRRSTWSWIVGMCYGSIDRKGHQSYIAHNNKSWCLGGERAYNTHYSVIHNNKLIQLPHQISSDRVRICLDYEAGQLSFYELCDPIRHLYTFTATFTEPLYAALYINHGYLKILGDSSCEEPSS